MGEQGGGVGVCVGLAGGVGGSLVAVGWGTMVVGVVVGGVQVQAVTRATIARTSIRFMVFILRFHWIPAGNLDDFGNRLVIEKSNALGSPEARCGLWDFFGRAGRFSHLSWER